MNSSSSHRLKFSTDIIAANYFLVSKIVTIDS
jgi:hypothetical protein